MSDRIANVIGNIADRRSTTWMFSAVIALLFTVFDLFADLSTLRVSLTPRVHSLVQAGMVGAGAGSIALVLLNSRRERRRRIREELLRVRELNHHMRNSLQVIVSAQYANTDEGHKTMVLEAAQRMDDKLRELFPALGVDRRKRPRVAVQTLSTETQ